MIQDLFKETEERMRKCIEATRHEFTLVRTGRASPAILEHVRVEMYGSMLPIQQVGAISVPEPRQLMITPFDRAALAHIEKAIMKSDVNLTPNNDGNSIRLNIPPLTEERRKDLVKVVHGKAEGGRVAIRNVRHDSVKKVQAMRKDKENPISESEEKRSTEQIQKFADKFIAEVDALTKAKEVELLEV